jgi:hypothetical protein
VQVETEESNKNKTDQKDSNSNNNKNRKTTAPGNGSGSGTAAGPDVLRARQERVLDEMMGVLFLRKRQAPVMGLLEETFGVVLRFARLSGAGGGGGKDGAETPPELYRLFRKKVEVFVTVCRGLGEKMAVSAAAAAAAGEGASMGREGAGCVEQLLLRLDMAGFYGREVVG